MSYSTALWGPQVEGLLVEARKGPLGNPDRASLFLAGDEGATSV